MKAPSHPTLNLTAQQQRLLEGVLLRLARLPDADGFVLRGGMLMRHWFRPLERVAGDLDLVATFPHSVEETARRLAPLLADRGVADGVTFDPKRVRVEGIWEHTDQPGVRLFASGKVGRTPHQFSVDVTFGEPLVPAPELLDYPTRGSGLTARLWACRPETIVGRKLQALQHMGKLNWRPKDLCDLRLLLANVALTADDLPAAIAASFASRGHPPAEARRLFARGWWRLKTSSARWLAFARGPGAAGLGVPTDLAEVVAEVVDRLRPVLERLG